MTKIIGMIIVCATMMIKIWKVSNCFKPKNRLERIAKPSLAINVRQIKIVDTANNIIGKFDKISLNDPVPSKDMIDLIHAAK